MISSRKLISTILLILLSYGSNKIVYGTKIEVEQGWVVGKEELSEEGRTYYSFQSIPFALPPIGDLRFAAPKPLPEWEGDLDARQMGPSCAQAALGYDEGVEDCLHLSIYSPKLPKSSTNASMPVLVWFHGGAFVTGGAGEYSPHLMMDRDIVLVIPQYRLGMLGFYKSLSPHGFGNYGMLDQVTALKWVNRNIAKFGGDPNETTLGGDCAGGVSSIHHMLSPLSQGLFQRVMSFSGSPLSYWAIHPRHNRLGLLISKTLMCPAYDLEILTKCFREKTVEELLETQKHVLEARDLLVGNSKLAPSIQIPAHNHISTLFLEDHPLKLLLNGDFYKVPVLLSVTRDVGSYLVDIALYDFITVENGRDPEFLKKILSMILKELDIPDYESKEEKFKKFYLPNWNYKDVDQAVQGLSHMLGDSAFNSAIISLAKILSEQVQTRLLRFDYEDGPKYFDIRHSEDNLTLPKPPIPDTAISHGDELYFFLPYERVELTKEHKKVANTMLNIVEDFVYGREPLQEWPTFTPSGLETTIVTAKGGLERGARFTDQRREDFLQYIFQNQHQKILEEIQSEGNVDMTKWKHDEL